MLSGAVTGVQPNEEVSDSHQLLPPDPWLTSLGEIRTTTDSMRRPTHMRGNSVCVLLLS